MTRRGQSGGVLHRTPADCILRSKDNIIIINRLNIDNTKRRVSNGRYKKDDDTHLTLCIRPILWPVSQVWQSWFVLWTIRSWCCNRCYCCRPRWPWSAVPRRTCPRPWPANRTSAGTPWLYRWSSQNLTEPRIRLHCRVLRVPWRRTVQTPYNRTINDDDNSIIIIIVRCNNKSVALFWTLFYCQYSYPTGTAGGSTSTIL